MTTTAPLAVADAGAIRSEPLPGGLRTIAAGGAGQMAARALTLLLQTASFAIVARVLSTEGFAAYATALALAALVSVGAELGMVNTVLVHLGRRPDDEGRVLAEGLVATLALAAAAALVVSPAVVALPADARLGFLALVPWIVVGRIVAVVQSHAQLHLRFGRLALADVAGRAVTIALLAALLVSPPVGGGAVLAVGAALAAGALTHLALVAPYGVLHLRWSPGLAAGAARLARAAVPLGIVGALTVVHTRIDQLMLSALADSGEVASYAVGYRMLDGAVAVLAVGGTVCLSVLARSSTDERAARLRAAVLVLTAAGWAASTAIFVLAPQLVSLLGGGRYPGATSITRLLAPVALVAGVNAAVAGAVIVHGRVRALVGVAAASVVLNVVCNLVLVPHWGASGAAVATLLSEGLALALALRLAQRSLGGLSLARPVGGAVLLLGAGSGASLWLWRAGAPWASAAVVLLGAAAIAALAASARGDRVAVAAEPGEEARR